MRPPICAVCNKDFRSNASEGGLLEFKFTEKDIQLLKKMERPGFVCHPPATEWFCGEHYEKAKVLTHLTLSEALAILNQ